jgi:protein-tyrosine phosphatase
MPTQLSWPNCVNARDLGGLPAGERRIREGALIRSDSLDRLTPESAAVVKAAGISRIVDLRGVPEVEAMPHPFGADEGVYRHIPLIDPAREPERNRSAERSLTDIYRSSVVRNARTIVAGVAAIADAPPGAVVVHCAVGKDRTGMTIAIALSVAGADDATIAEDYEVSGTCLQAEREALLAKLTDESQLRHVTERMSCRAETILGALDEIRSSYGTIEAYLQTFGMTTDQITRLRERLTE